MFTLEGEFFFHSTVFNEDADFHAAEFCSEVEFSSARFKSTTNFTSAHFKTHVPKFHATELYDDTVFPTPKEFSENWPLIKEKADTERQDKSIKVMEAAEQKRAYSRLRLFMSKSLQIDEEQFFHRMVMRCKGEIEKSIFVRFLYGLFEGVSEFGSSVRRPIFWLCVVWLAGAIAKLDSMKGAWWPDWHSIPQAMGWSFANLFSFFGFYRRYFEDRPQ